MKRLFLMLSLLCLVSVGIYAQKQFTLASPDGKVSTTITVGDMLQYSISIDGQQVLAPSPISMTLSTGEVWGQKPSLRGNKRSSVNQDIASPLYRAATLTDSYNALTLNFRKDYSVEFRAYNDGVAYRFATTRKTPFNVVSDGATFNFDKDYTMTASYVRDGKDGDWASQFANSFENIYTVEKLSKYNTGHLTFLPVVVDTENAKVCITEVNLEGYPGLYLKGNGNSTLTGMNAPYPKVTKQGGHNQLEDLVQEGEDYIAKVEGPRSFPWRVAIVAKEDKGIAASTLSYLLAEPSRLADISWIQPGKVAWDWWNNWNISGVDFRAGINTETYKYYIDFAADKGIEYVILDEGWAVNLQADLMQIIPEIDMKEIVDYGKQKNVGIVLWAGYYAFNRDMENVCKYYSDMGVKGFKIDFMNRDDQPMTEFMYRAAAMCAKYHLLADFHGTYKPAGLNRTYPNAINFEGVHGLEQMKWQATTVDQLQYDVTIPYIRQAAGPMDYTQGAMLNGGLKNYFPVNSEPMSQGTRCHQLGLYIVLDSPLNMMCDSPTNYLREPECTELIAGIPTVWDETVVLDGKMGEYIVTARRSGSTWYVGGITNREARDLTVDLSFLDGTYHAELYKDGINADRKGADYRVERFNTAGGKSIHLAPGGGFVVKLTK